MSNTKDYAASRVSVFDAATLDKEIEGFLRNQITFILRDLDFSAVESCGPEIEAALKVLLWLFSVERHGATFGQQLLKLRYKRDSEKLKLRALGLFLIGFPYLKDRSHIFSALQEKFPKWLTLALSHFEATSGILNLIAVLVFLRRGGTPVFIERALGITPVSTVKPFERSIGYSYITRELLWHGAIELFCLFLPHINIPKLSRIARNTVFGKPNAPPSSPPAAYSSQIKCSICRQKPVIPHTIGCLHFFCYVCISSALLSDRKFECPSCSYANPKGAAELYVAA